nr:hypothetical protein [Tanacetum cinerariifolium]
MSSDSHATITYTSMSSYEVIVNGYYGMPMDPLDPYVQLVIEAPPSPDYIPGPEAPPSPDYIPRPEAPPSPDYIPGPEYPEYLPPANDMLPVEEQPLSAAVSPTVESPGYITESELEMEPEENDGDDEKSKGDSIDYPTSGGDNDANDDGDDLLEDDADDEDEEESSDSEEEEEEHLALTVPAPALYTLYSFVSASKETEPFEEGETTATPPLFGYRVAAWISVQPHILMPFRLESEVEILLVIPTPPLSLVSPTSYLLPPLLMPLPMFTPLPTSSFPLPSSLPSTSVMLSDSLATITYTSMSNYEVIVNGYYGMPMDPLDPYVQLVMEAPPSPDYIPGPKAPPSPDYIPGLEAPPSPDYIPGPKYLEYLPPADDVLPAEEQPKPKVEWFGPRKSPTGPWVLLLFPLYKYLFSPQEEEVGT